MRIKPLSPIDSVFLLGESPQTPMHIGGLMQFELPSDAGKDFVANVVTRFRACTVFRTPWNRVLEKPRRRQLIYRQREVHDIDMEYHVRHLALPHPGGERELGQLISRLHSQHMDLRRPLWECHVIEGLDNNRFAIYVKIHHALADGISASRLLTHALATDPDAIGQLPFWATGCKASRPPVQAVKKRKWPAFITPRSVLSALRETGQIWTGTGNAPDINLTSAPHSILNGRISPHRRFATHAEPLDRLKRLAKAADASLNDVVIALTGTALRDYLADLNALPQDPLTVSVPVSLREDDSASGNQISMIFASLATHVADDRARLEAVKHSTASAKQQLQAMSPDAKKVYPGLMFLPVVAASLLDVGGRGKPPFNVVVSNVPGGNEERYLYGARLTNLYPLNIPMHGMAFNVTCYSHAGNVNFGLIACRDTVPHVQRIAVNLREAVERLEKAYGLKTSKSPRLKAA